MSDLCQLTSSMRQSKLVGGGPGGCPQQRQACAQALHDEFEVDFVSLSFARTADDVVQAREFLDSVGLTTTKARPAPLLAWPRLCWKVMFSRFPCFRGLGVCGKARVCVQLTKPCRRASSQDRGGRSQPGLQM